MSDEQDKLKVSLEPPKLFGRKKKSGKAETASAPEHGQDPAASTEAPTAPSPHEGAIAPGTEPEPVDAETTPETVAETAEPGPTSRRDEADDSEVIETAPAATAYDREETTVLPVDDDAPIMDEIETGPDEDDDLGPVPASAAPAGPSMADRIRGRFGTKARSRDGASRPEEEHDQESDAGTAYTAPMLDHYPAAVLTGAIVGLGMVVLTWLSLRGCEAIRGTASCGGGPGFLLLVAMFIISVMLGSAILKSFEVPDPGSSSFLAVGLVAVVALLLLIEMLDHWSMLLVVPIISIGGYLLSVYVTKTFVEPGD